MNNKQKYHKYKNKYVKLKTHISHYRNMKRAHLSRQIEFDKDFIEDTKQHIQRMEKCYKKINKMKTYKKLIMSVYPYQASKYFLLKLPKWYPTTISQHDVLLREKIGLPKIKKLKYVPCDARLKNLVLYLWKYKIVTHGWDDGGKYYNGFISFNPKTVDGDDAINKIKLLLNKTDIASYKVPKNLFGKKYITWLENKEKNHKSDIFFIKHDKFNTISFDHTSLKNIHKQLNIIEPDISKALPGYFKCGSILKK